MPDELTADLRAALLVVAGLDRPPADREMWARRDRVEYDHGPGVVAGLIALGLAVEWMQTDGPQLSPTPWGLDRLRATGLRVEADEACELVSVDATDDLGKPVRYEEVVERDFWREPPPEFLPYGMATPGRPWPYRLPPRRHAFPLPFAEMAVDDRPGPVEEAIRLEEWGRIVGGEVAVDPRTGDMVRTDGPTPGPVTILGATVRAGRPRRAG